MPNEVAGLNLEEDGLCGFVPVEGVTTILPHPILPGLTLAEAQGILRGGLRSGVPCPCCGQNAKVYKRKFHSGMARDVIVFYRHTRKTSSKNPSGWFKATDVLMEAGAQRADYDKLVLWDLLERGDEKKDDGNSAGMFRLTGDGIGFVEGTVVVASHVLIYNGRMLAFSEEDIGIRDALGRKFDYSELMNA